MDPIPSGSLVSYAQYPDGYSSGTWEGRSAFSDFMETRKAPFPSPSVTIASFAHFIGVVRAGQHVLWADSVRPVDPYVPALFDNYTTQASEFSVGFSGSLPNPQTNSNFRFIHARHNNGANLLYCDGHVEWTSASDLLGMGEEIANKGGANHWACFVDQNQNVIHYP